MINFTREQRGKAFDALPKEIKVALMSSAIQDIYQGIAKKYSLAIDQTGVLMEIITLTILNLIPRQDIVANLSKGMRIDDDKAANLATDINNLIFLKLREIMQEEEQRHLMEIEKTDDEEISKSEGIVTLSQKKVEKIDSEREQILAEIENPKPTTQLIATANKDTTVANAFIGGKLTETVRMPQQKATIELKKPEPPKKYSADPYREPAA